MQTLQKLKSSGKSASSVDMGVNQIKETVRAQFDLMNSSSEDES